ncbi:metallophosphoesterase [Acidothermaceae bacterium B102]|nr:metallophosphoesterase [Acidothermaceae bacterium B102]
MRVHVVSDVHGATEALARAGDGADALICLGDLVLYVDYDDHRRGIFADLFGADAATRLVELRTAKRFDDAKVFSDALWQGTHGSRREVLEGAVRRQYAETFAAMPTPSYLTYGNVDLPALWPEFLREGMQLLDGQRVEIGGRVFGFVGGGLRTPYRTPYEISDEDYAAKVAAVGAVDVLCCHIPPALPELLYDVRARRFERGSEAVLEAIRDTQPGLVLFGHVHNPLVRRRRIGRTECVNVGHFASTGTPYKIDF